MPPRRSISCLLPGNGSSFTRKSPVDGSVAAGGGGIWLATGDEKLLGGAAIDPIERELAGSIATQLEQQFSSIVGQGVHCIHQPHPRRFIQVRRVSHTF